MRCLWVGELGARLQSAAALRASTGTTTYWLPLLPATTGLMRRQIGIGDAEVDGRQTGLLEDARKRFESGAGGFAIAVAGAVDVGVLSYGPLGKRLRVQQPDGAREAYSKERSVSERNTSHFNV